MLKQEKYMENLEEMVKEPLTTAERRKIQKEENRNRKDAYMFMFLLALTIVILWLNMV